MLSAIILVPAHPVSRKHPFGPLLRTLAALVPVTVEGAVRDVTLLNVGASTDVANIADEAGCRIVQAETFEAAFRQSVTAARTSWICLLQAGTIPGATFGEDVSAAIDEAGDVPKGLLLRSGGGVLARYIPMLSPIVGVIAAKSRFGTAACRSFDDVIGKTRPARSLPSRVAFL